MGNIYDPLLLLGVSYTAPDTETGRQVILTHGGKELHPYVEEMPELELLRYVFSKIESAEYHEMKEWFRYRGVMVYDPHRTERAEMEKVGP